jgi:hypothetical protein
MLGRSKYSQAQTMVDNSSCIFAGHSAATRLYKASRVSTLNKPDTDTIDLDMLCIFKSEVALRSPSGQDVEAQAQWH